LCCQLHHPRSALAIDDTGVLRSADPFRPSVDPQLACAPAMGSLIKKRRKRMRKKKHKKMLKATRWQRRAGK
jgi:hypothetical protein